MLKFTIKHRVKWQIAFMAFLNKFFEVIKNFNCTSNVENKKGITVGVHDLIKDTLIKLTNLKSQ